MLDIFFDMILPILSIIIPVFATVYTVNKRIKAQTRENHQPHLVLESIKTISSIDKYRFHLTLVGKNYSEKNIDIKDAIELESEGLLNVEISLKNIGYGVSTNIKFYNLLTGHQIYGSQKSSETSNQKLYTTFDIGAGEIKKISAQIISDIQKSNDGILEENNTILCVYKDLNNNVDSFIMTINDKKNNHYDYFAYQPSSLSYRKMIKENKKNYKRIINKYVDL